MSGTILSDPNADARSLMKRAPCLCDGEKTGVPCKNFWTVWQKFDAANADGLRTGERSHSCTLTESFLLEWTSEEQPTGCNRYSPRPAEGLFALVQRAVGLVLGLKPNANSRLSSTPGYVRFDADFTAFKPMTLEEIEALREEFPDRPITWSAGKDPSKMSAAEIFSSEPIGMLKPGEQIPGSLSVETQNAVNSIFESGLFDKKEEDNK